MKQLTIISGKGGTGKTSVTASFAVLAGQAVLADCDVDAADLHLVMAPRLVSRQPFSGGKVAFIDQGRCTACGHCQQLCRFDAVCALPANRNPTGVSYRIDSIACEGCGVCAYFCPERAVRLPDAENGEWFLSDTRIGPMVHARLGVAEENSGKLVTTLRGEARKVAERHGCSTIIIDGSPGTGCPVIASITGTDLALLVAEPTMSGLHDLQRVADLTRHFQIPTAIAINKWDINPDMTAAIERSAEERRLPVLGRIRYDPQVTRAQILGKAVVELNDAPAAADLRKLWQAVAAMLHTGP